MNDDRRTVLKGLAAVSAAAVTGCGGSTSGDLATPDVPRGTEQPVAFEHGVASGDPLSDRVMLWTRVTPQNTAPHEQPVVPVTVTVAHDVGMTQTVRQYQAQARPERDYCVKVDATGLQQDRWYYYQFSVGNQRSPVGRTRTFPAAGRFVDRARFAVVSCSNYAFGLFSVYRAVAEQSDLDFVLHLGDYIYEYGPGEYGNFPDREPLPPREIISLADYRARYAQYRTDTDLQRAHQQFPMICVWDDHESANDSWIGGAENHQVATEGDWAPRKAASQQAYFEWLPIREQTPGNIERIWRDFRFGDLIDLFMLDTRLEGRDEPLSVPFDPARNSASRRMISEAQSQWLRDGLADSSARWRVIGQQVMFAQINIAEIPAIDPRVPELRGNLSAINMDQWDGYAAERLRLLNHIRDQAIDNVVILTGDIHSSWASEVYRNPVPITGELFAQPLAAEFVTPSVTSPGFPEGLSELAGIALPLVNPHIRYFEGKSRGFVLMDVNRQRAQAEWYYVRSITDFDQRGQLDLSRTKSMKVDSGSSRLVRDPPLSRPRTLRTALNNPSTPEILS
ncbi:alkaline phosphatase D family protein [Alcanivorax sp. JB21]|uniref:alkaline phosphatase D family protein n=1 Tax=Alcanivorax limicola TaxID=2874102 RepID=UPI001CBF25F3|nr:alkaline phosphatase D family protein [Alcanivorax limicola]MBZ2189345.1 alkaline phosphatase D family protein [Alcanivorax limicola]